MTRLTWLLVVAGALLLMPPSAEAAARAARVLYGSDWSGTTQIYAVTADGKRVSQITFGRAPACGQAACGYGRALPSPDGRQVIFSDWAACEASSDHPSLFVARADGSRRRRLAKAIKLSPCYVELSAEWSPDSRRIAYQVEGVIHVVGRDLRGHRVVGPGGGVEWAPRGGALAYTSGSTLWVERGQRAAVVAAPVEGFVWSPTGRWLAYQTRRAEGGDDLEVVRPDGSGRRTLLRGYMRSPSWSGDGRFLAVRTTDGVAFIDVATGRARVEHAVSELIAWKRAGHEAAVTRDGAIYLMNAESGAMRMLSPDAADEGAWSPDGRRFAYVHEGRHGHPFGQRDLKIVTADGDVQAVMSSSGDYGGFIDGLTWTRPAREIRYRPARPRSVAAVSGDTVTAPWPVTRLAADGSRVAYVSCGHVFVWTPATRQVYEADPVASLAPACSTPGYYLPRWIYTLALGRDRVAWGTVVGNMGQSWWIGASTLSAPRRSATFGRIGSASGCSVTYGGLGDLTAAGSLLVFSTWRDAGGCPKAKTLEQQIRRAEPNGCPCPVIASAAGPLPPFDVEGGRIATGGDNATVVLDANGKELVSIPVSPLGAQLTGSHLVVLVQGRLLDYDAERGVLLHAWPLPDVSSGVECGSPHSGTWECNWGARLMLQDAAQGLVAYVLDGTVHVVRLADGADAVVATGALARFTSEGLAYAAGPQIRHVPFASLPLRAF